MEGECISRTGDPGASVAGTRRRSSLLGRFRDGSDVPPLWVTPCGPSPLGSPPAWEPGGPRVRVSGRHSISKSQWRNDGCQCDRHMKSLWLPRITTPSPPAQPGITPAAPGFKVDLGDRWGE